MAVSWAMISSRLLAGMGFLEKNNLSDRVFRITSIQIEFWLS
jgi:hypothetical protein